MTTVNTLFHYCGAESFISILRSHSIWLSSLTLSNDSMEGRLVSAAVLRLAERDGLDASARERLQESLAFTERFFDGLGFCLSEDGDLLSQWRGYADDARGVSIGFDRNYLESLAESSKGNDTSGFALYKVEYEADKHEAQVKPIYQELRNLIDAGAFNRSGRSLLDSRTDEEIAKDDQRIKQAHTELVLKVLELFPTLYQLKAAAFREEREWRLVSMLVNSVPGNCLFRSARTRIIPYRAFELADRGIPAIKEIVLGPRHETPLSVVQLMVKQAGFGEVPVRRSEATYR